MCVEVLTCSCVDIFFYSVLSCLQLYSAILFKSLAQSNNSHVPQPCKVTGSLFFVYVFVYIFIRTIEDQCLIDIIFDTQLDLPWKLQETTYCIFSAGNGNQPFLKSYTSMKWLYVQIHDSHNFGSLARQTHSCGIRWYHPNGKVLRVSFHLTPVTIKIMLNSTHTQVPIMH